MMTSSELVYNKSLEELYSDYETSPSGLDTSEAQKRLKYNGLNSLREVQNSVFSIFVSQFQNSIVFILIAAALLSFVMGEETDAFFIIGILILNSILGFIQEYRAENSIQALKKLTETHVRVKRSGLELLILSEQLVVGDITPLAEGDLISADMRLIESQGLHVDEATLTGESIPTSKQILTPLAIGTPIYERSNMLFSGTFVTKGTALALVTATGENTYLATIAKSAQKKSPLSPLTRALAIFSKRLIFALIFILIIVGIIGFFSGIPYATLASILTAELVSAVPEGLPIVVTLILALGAFRLSKHKVLVRHLPAVESLGSATVIATDKTGTITEGFLSVDRAEVIDEKELMQCAALCNDATLEHGDAVDKALVLWLESEYEPLRENNPRIFFHPFDPKSRFMATLNKMNQEKERLHVKGAYETLRTMSANTQEELARLDAAHDNMASKGLRLLAFAICDENWEDPDTWKIKIVGLIGFADAAKAGVEVAVKKAQDAGIRVIMITGDNQITAQVIAKDVGIYKEGDLLLNGNEVETFSDEKLQAMLQNCTVIARALPEHKYKIVKLLQEKGEIVVVTGDGVNDVPALKAADLGIAMGNGSEAAKSVAKMVITNNNLSVIVDAIKQGRIITANLKKVILYLLATCFDEIIVISGGMILGLPLAVLATQILWINIVTDGMVDKTFAMCTEEGDVMKNPPRKIDTQFFDRWQIGKITWISLVNALITLALFAYLLKKGYAYEIPLTVSFCTIVTSQWVNAVLAQKSEEPFFLNIKKSFTINPYVWIGLALGILLQGSVLYFVPSWLHVITPTPWMLGYIMMATLLTFLLIESYQWAIWILKKRFY